MNPEQLEWVQLSLVRDLPEGRVKTVTSRNRSICLSHHRGR
jgi:hypothetical protein